MPSHKFDLRTDMHPNVKNVNKKRIVFMGTGLFAAPLLETLLTENSYAHVVSVVTKPDARVGRSARAGRKNHSNPIKEISLSHGIHLDQPVKLNDAFIEDLAQIKPDILIVASYGKILPAKLLAVPTYGAVNVHASLLPLLRGASPIQNALLAGLTETGITVIQMDEGLDTGDMLAQATLAIDSKDTHLTLQKKLSDLSCSMILATLSDIISSKIKPQPQDHRKATLCQMIDRADGHLQWMRSNSEIINRLNAFTPWPGIFSYWKRTGAEQIRIKLLNVAEDTDLPKEIINTYTPSTIFAHENRIYVRTADAALEIITLQKEGSKETDAQSFVNGHRDFIGAMLV